MKIESRTVAASKSPKEMYEFLTDVKNYRHIMPENITKFEVRDDESFIFALKGMPEIKLRIKEKTPYTRVALGSASDKFDFELASLIGESENGSKVQLTFNGDFNPMMAMMVKKPLTNFITKLADGISEL